jgi:DNA-directed RNA polymerase subunit omega
MILQEENQNNQIIEQSVFLIPNRFELTLCAAYRARLLSQGHSLMVEREKYNKLQKNTTLALAEIAEQTCGLELLKKVPL